MNRLQTAMIWLAVLEVMVCCLSMPLFMARAQEVELIRDLSNEEVFSANLSANGEGVIGPLGSGLSLEQKITIANSYDNTVTSILLDKGENYTPNQICSIGAGDLEDVFGYYAGQSELMDRVSNTQLIESVKNFGIYLEEQSHASNDEVGYADVETVDEVDVDADSVYINGDNEVSMSAMMYVNSSEPDQLFIVWQISYYSFVDDSTIFIIIDDETGKLLSITGSFGGDSEGTNNSLYSSTSETSSMLINYYQLEEQGALEEE